MRCQLVHGLNKLVPELVGQHRVALHVGPRYFFLHLLLLLDFSIDLEAHFALSNRCIIS